MNRNITLTLIAFFLIIISASYVSAIEVLDTSPVYKVNEAVDLKVRCFDSNNTLCLSSATCFIDVDAPDGDNIVSNGSMTRQPTFYNYTLNNTDVDELGRYGVVARCLGSQDGFSTFTFIITQTGEVLSDAEAKLFLGLLFMAVVLFCLCLLGFIRIPYENPRSDDRLIIGIQHLKYVKILMGYFAYLLLVFISFMLWTTAASYLFLDVAALWFKFVFYALVGTLFPLTVAFVIFGFIRFALDRNIQRGIRRGIPVR